MIYLLVGLHVNDDILYTFLQLSFEEVMQRAYETFHIELNSIQVLYALPGEYITTRIVQEIERGIREGGGVVVLHYIDGKVASVYMSF